MQSSLGTPFDSALAAAAGAPVADAAAEIPALAAAAVLGKCAPMPDGVAHIKGYDFNNGIDFSALLQTYKYMGIQAANLGLAVEEINRMVRQPLDSNHTAGLPCSDLRITHRLSVTCATRMLWRC